MRCFTYLRSRLLRCSSTILVSLVLGLVAIPSAFGKRRFLRFSYPRTASFVLEGSEQPFRASGFNYDHDENGRLLEDYWESEWPKIEEDFREMKVLGAKVIRIHLQFGRFMQSPTEIRKEAIDRLVRLVQLARETRLYLNLTGLGCYHKGDVPAWYDALDEEQRWEAQAQFWIAVAKATRNESSIFCFDLMNEPVVSGGKRPPGDWLGPPFAGKHFVQFVSLDPMQRSRPTVAKAWISKLTAAIRSEDPQRLITVGLVDWSLDRPGLTSGFVPHVVEPHLDFISVHIYPESMKLDQALETLKGFDLKIPLVVEECFPLKCTSQELIDVMKRADFVEGWTSFYWGADQETLRRSSRLQDAMLLHWLEAFHP
ncbi:MAG: cellulase family glycosylhydrolase [Pirellulales bacterium]